MLSCGSGCEAASWDFLFSMSSPQAPLKAEELVLLTCRLGISPSGTVLTVRPGRSTVGFFFLPAVCVSVLIHRLNLVGSSKCTGLDFPLLTVLYSPFVWCRVGANTWECLTHWEQCADRIAAPTTGAVTLGNVNCRSVHTACCLVSAPFQPCSAGSDRRSFSLLWEHYTFLSCYILLYSS